MTGTHQYSLGEVVGLTGSNSLGKDMREGVEMVF